MDVLANGWKMRETGPSVVIVFWGTPLPIWKSEDGDCLCFGSVAELEEASGQKVEDLHKHLVDDLVIVQNDKNI